MENFDEKMQVIYFYRERLLNGCNWCENTLLRKINLKLIFNHLFSCKVTQKIVD